MTAIVGATTVGRSDTPILETGTDHHAANQSRSEATLPTTKQEAEMSPKDDGVTPKRGPEHDVLAVFLGNWTAKGTSYGGTDQSGPDPKANGVPWTSTHVGRWHTGEFFLIQDEKARPAGDVFDTLSVMGVDPETGKYFAAAFENHGFFRRYDVTVNGRVWTISGKTERATIEFSPDDRTQTIVWEWKPEGRWLPLCARVAVRTD